MIHSAAAVSLALLFAAAEGPPLSPVARGSLHVGWASGGWSLGGRHAFLVDSLARDPWRIALAVGVDGWLRPAGGEGLLDSTMGGLRLSTLYLRADTAGAEVPSTRTSFHLARLEGVATVHSRRPIGPYLRIGLGPAGLRHEVRVPGLASGSLVAWGGGLSLGLGAFAVASDRSELRLELEGAAQAWLPSGGGPAWSWTAGGSVGLSWW